MSDDSVYFMFFCSYTGKLDCTGQLLAGSETELFRVDKGNAKIIFSELKDCISDFKYEFLDSLERECKSHISDFYFTNQSLTEIKNY